MIIHATNLAGLFTLKIEPKADDRGYLARTFCAREFAAAGLPVEFVQCNVSVNLKQGTLRGMHYQREPSPEGKLVSCVRGHIFDVALDLRVDSATYCHWAGFELSEKNGDLLYIPPGFAHGFQTLVDDCAVFYQMTEYYCPELSAGVRWNDPAFGIDWPLSSLIMSERDRSFPNFRKQT